MAAVGARDAAAGGTATSRPSRWRGALTWVLILGAIAGWTVYLRPASLGGSTGYVIVSGESMQPVMHTGDLAIVRSKPTYDEGEVVAYRIPASDVGGGMLVIHRVIGGNATDGLILQGDNRDHPDMWRPTSGDVVGALQANIPDAGTVLFLFRTPLVLATAAGLLGFWFIVLRDDDEPAPQHVEAEPAAADIAEQPVRPPQPARSPAPAAPPQPAYRPLVGAAMIGVAIGLAVGGTGRR